jgi:hypothetical protein
MKQALGQLRKLRNARRDALMRQVAQARRSVADAQAVFGNAEGMAGEADAWLAAAQRQLRAAEPQATQLRAARIAQASALAQRRQEVLAGAADMARRCADELGAKRSGLLAAQRALQRFDVWDELDQKARSACELGVELEDEAEAGAASHKRTAIGSRA